jgi:hypothetical protein
MLVTSRFNEVGELTISQSLQLGQVPLCLVEFMKLVTRVVIDAK